MKLLAFLLCSIAAGPAAAADPVQLAQVQAVYVLPMAGGLDQFLANRLTTNHVFQVVTDPKKADAIFTDRLGEPFEKRFDELFPPPEPPKPEPTKAEEKDKDANKEKDKDKDAGVEEAKDTTGERPVRAFATGRGKGTIFLVDTKSKAVIWSTYQKPKNSTAEQLDHTAARITNRLKEDLKPK